MHWILHRSVLLHAISVPSAPKCAHRRYGIRYGFPPSGPSIDGRRRPYYGYTGPCERWSRPGRSTYIIQLRGPRCSSITAHVSNVEHRATHALHQPASSTFFIHCTCLTMPSLDKVHTWSPSITFPTDYYTKTSVLKFLKNTTWLPVSALFFYILVPRNSDIASSLLLHHWNYYGCCSPIPVSIRAQAEFLL